MYKIPDLQYFKLNSLDIDCSVYIELPHCIINYKIKRSCNYFLQNSNGNFSNDKIFTELGIRSPKDFVKNIVGYECAGIFPAVKNKEDLLKVIIALDKECIKEFGDKNMQSQFKDGDYISIEKDGDIRYIMIFKQFVDNRIYRYANYCYRSGNLLIDKGGYLINDGFIVEHATKGESKILDNELLERGLAWDATCKKLVSADAIKSKVLEKYDCISNLIADKKTESEKINLFPAKKHYQFNFSIN